jgi:hypothetical protein
MAEHVRGVSSKVIIEEASIEAACSELDTTHEPEAAKEMKNEHADEETLPLIPDEETSSIGFWCDGACKRPGTIGKSPYTSVFCARTAIFVQRATVNAWRRTEERKKRTGGRIVGRTIGM